MWWFRSPILLLAVSVLATCVSPSAAGPPAELSATSFHIGAPAGIRRLRPETWGLVAVDAVNAGDQPADVLAITYFAEEPNLQYGRRLWIPPRSRRRSWCPILPPHAIPPDPGSSLLGTTQVELKWLLFDRSGPTEVLLRNRFEQMAGSRPLSIHHSRAITGVMFGGGANDEAQDDAVLDTIAAMRVSDRLSPLIVILYEDFLPPVVESLDGLDQLVLAGDRLASDAAGLVAVRRWLHRGGRLWVMLDKVDPTTVELLLGNGLRCQVVDRVGLCRVLIKEVDDGSEIPLDPPREFEEPVDLVRVLATDVEVTYTVNGWPASFWQRVGKGDVLFTTLGARAWVRPRTAHDPEPNRLLDEPESVATKPLAELGFRLSRPRQPPILKPQQFEPYLSEQIGYRIVSRGSVIGVLGTFCLVLLGSWVWMSHKGRPDRMVWLGPVAAAVAAAVLIAMGFRAREAVEPTVAVAQLAEVEPGSDDLGMTGLAAMYNRETTGAPLGALRGGIFRPDMTGLGGTTRRMVRTDLDTWHWEHLALPAGVRTAPFEYSTKISHPIEARAAFGPHGLTGSLTSGPFQGTADAIIATPSHANLAVELDEEGGFSAGVDNVLASGEFVAGVLLSDEQRRRQLVYEQLLPGGPQSKYPHRPMLLAWASPLDMQFTFPPEARRDGSALLAVPLTIERSPPGTRVAIPSPFLPYRSVQGPRRQISSAYSNTRREWLELRVPSQIRLRFQVPGEVLPIELDRAVLTLRINAPSRDFELFGFSDGRPVTLATRTSPVGTLPPFEIDRADLLELDERGGLLLRINVGGETTTKTAWRIEQVQLKATGEVQGER